eukprot:gene8567-1005_t
MFPPFPSRSRRFVNGVAVIPLRGWRELGGVVALPQVVDSSKILLQPLKRAVRDDKRKLSQLTTHFNLGYMNSATNSIDAGASLALDQLHLGEEKHLTKTDSTNSNLDVLDGDDRDELDKNFEAENAVLTAIHKRTQ